MRAIIVMQCKFSQQQSFELHKPEVTQMNAMEQNTLQNTYLAMDCDKSLMSYH